MANKHRRSGSKSSTQNNTPESPTSPDIQPSQHLPPKRVGKATKRTAAPLYKTNFNNFIYSLGALVLFLFAFYTYRIMSWKTDAGGWWNLATGQRNSNKPPPPATKESNDPSGINAGNVEAKVSELASAFDIPPATLASALRSVISAHAPPETLSSISSEAGKADKTVAASLVKDDMKDAKKRSEGLLNRLSNVVGFDDAGADAVLD